jgi:hypothetical protein
MCIFMAQISTVKRRWPSVDRHGKFEMVKIGTVFGRGCFSGDVSLHVIPAIKNDSAR